MIYLRYGLRGISKLDIFPNTHVNKCFSSAADSKKVFLNDYHLQNGAKLVDFAGYMMPIQYSDLTISASHRHTREHASLFDVSHMLQTKIFGRDRIKFIESLVVSDIEGMDQNQGTLTLFTNNNGGIIDDLIVSKTDQEYLYVVSNAACAEKDLNHMTGNMEAFCKQGGDVKLEVIKDKALLALQGPEMVKVLQPLIDTDFNALSFMKTVCTTICGVSECRISRCGYTGEDGVEISVPADKSNFIAEKLLKSKTGDVKLAGLGARDTLRLEAGLCLYGNDITDETTPIEASLAWTIGKRRRQEANFPGAKIILNQLNIKPQRKRVGFVSIGACPRASTPILSLNGTSIGTITSGCPSPCLNKNVSMGYVETASSKVGTKVKFIIHKKEVEGTIVKMPFVPTKYFVK